MTIEKMSRCNVTPCLHYISGGPGSPVCQNEMRRVNLAIYFSAIKFVKVFLSFLTVCHVCHGRDRSLCVGKQGWSKANHGLAVVNHECKHQPLVTPQKMRASCLFCIYIVCLPVQNRGCQQSIRFSSFKSYKHGVFFIGHGQTE